MIVGQAVARMPVSAILRDHGCHRSESLGGRGHGACVLTGAATPPGVGLWMAGRYEDVYRREGEVWRFEHVVVTLRMLSPYEGGWVQTPMMEVPG